MLATQIRMSVTISAFGTNRVFNDTEYICGDRLRNDRVIA